MEATILRGAHRILILNTIAFAVCFATWMANGVLITFLASNQVFDWGPVEIGWLMGIPVLTGALFRLPAGILTDKFGGKSVFGILLLLSSIPLFFLSRANSFAAFVICSFGFGLTGASFAVGIAYTSVWYPKNWQGTALGIFGAGNSGAALTTLLAPTLLKNLTKDGSYIEGWRTLPLIYSAMMVVMAIIFFIFTTNKKPAAHGKTLLKLLQPLKRIKVWRYGLYYFLVFGCFVAFSQWLVPYFVNVYILPLVTAGLFAALFSFPSGIVRAIGGWMSDKWGGTTVLNRILILSVLISFLLIIPKMHIISPGKGILSKTDGVVKEVTNDQILVGDESYDLKQPSGKLDKAEGRMLVFPIKDNWQKPVVSTGDTVRKRQLLAEGVTQIYFQANMWIFAVLVLLIGVVWGVGSAAVYKQVADSFPEEVGVVGGMVGVLGGLGGFFCPILFGYLLEGTGLWSSCWLLMFFLSAVCLLWTYRIMRKKNPEIQQQKVTEIEPELELL